MKGKQGKQVLILSVLLLGLVIAVIIQFSSGNAPTTAPQNAQASESATGTKPAEETPKEKKADLSWVDPQIMPAIVENVTRGRDPFKDNLMPEAVVVSRSVTTQPDMPKTNITGMLPPAGKIFSNPPTQPASPPVQYTPPPIPPFVLSGVIFTQDDRMATISINDRYYTLLEGEKVPGLGWTVVKIQANSVVLTDKSQNVLIRLPGGNSK